MNTHIRAGFKNAAVPQMNASIIKIFLGDLPASVIVLVIEHIAIAKSFGRINNYTIDPSQEFVAIGITNVLGPFLGAYPATGSFSRTAIKSKAGVRTPFAGVITAVVVLLAIYALPAVFFYIPNAALAAVIIHAVLDLIVPPNTVYQFWRVSPFEVPIFFAGILVTIFSNIENGIYTTIAVSFALFIYRIIKSKGSFLGKVTVDLAARDQIILARNEKSLAAEDGHLEASSSENPGTREIFLPLDHGDGSNPDILVTEPRPGVFIYRLSEGFSYPSANSYLDHLTAVIFARTRRTNPHPYRRRGDRPWNDPGPRRGHVVDEHADRPLLHAVILDFGAVNHVDVTSIQTLIDVRNQLDRYAAPSPVDWHFASLHNRWTKRALAAAGFGYPSPPTTSASAWKPIFSIAATTLNAKHAEQVAVTDFATRSQADDVSVKDAVSPLSTASTERLAVITGLNRPLFHVDLTSALQSAVANVEARQGRVSEDASVLEA